jgi:peptidoglycan/xylan/chitin deacetylase (PgdA/CDA1 family)
MSDTLVLCYHTISDGWSDTAAVRVDRFRRQVSLLASLGYKGVTFIEAAEGEQQGKRVAITFDDAFHSVLSLAFPALSQRGWPATVFVVTDFGDGERPLSWPPRFNRYVRTAQEPELRALDWAALRRLSAAGWEIGSHTVSHPHLTRLSAARARRELTASREACEAQLDRPCLSVAYPYGDCNQSVVDLAAEAGYRAGAALPERLHPIRPLEWPRIGVYNHDELSRFALKVLPPRRRLFDAQQRWQAVRRRVTWSRAVSASDGGHTNGAVHEMTPRFSRRR